MAITPQITPLKDCPATRAIEAFGGDLKVFAEAVGRHQTRVYRWTLARKDKGTGGLIPAQMQAKVLAEARARGLKLKAADLIGDVQ